MWPSSYRQKKIHAPESLEKALFPDYIVSSAKLVASDPVTAFKFTLYDQ